MRVTQNYKGIYIDQTAYLKEMIVRFEGLNIKKFDTPASSGEFLFSTTDEDQFDASFPYQSLVGSLIWLLKTRPDIAFAVSQCARYMTGHTKRHDRAAMRILGYLAKHPDWGIGFDMNPNPGGDIKVEIHADSSWADCKPTRFSSYGYNTYMCGGLIAWRCKKTGDVCMSSTEAEYNAYAEGSKECCFMKSFLDEIEVSIEDVIWLRGDSQSADRLATAWSVSQRSKHMDCRTHFVRHSIMTAGKHGLKRIGTKDNTADMHTKPLERQIFNINRGRSCKRIYEA
jgi:hypothetical protein